MITVLELVTVPTAPTPATRICAICGESFVTGRAVVTIPGFPGIVCYACPFVEKSELKARARRRVEILAKAAQGCRDRLNLLDEIQFPTEAEMLAEAERMIG